MKSWDGLKLKQQYPINDIIGRNLKIPTYPYGTLPKANFYKIGNTAYYVQLSLGNTKS